jgi:hypothetical protein
MTTRPTKQTVLTLFLPPSDDFGSVELELGLNEWGQPESLNIHYRLSPEPPPRVEIRPDVISPLRLAREVFDAIRQQHPNAEVFKEYHSCPSCDGLVYARDGKGKGYSYTCEACIADIWRRHNATGEPPTEL